MSETLSSFLVAILYCSREHYSYFGITVREDDRETIIPRQEFTDQAVFCADIWEIRSGDVGLESQHHDDLAFTSDFSPTQIELHATITN